MDQDQARGGAERQREINPLVGFRVHGSARLDTQEDAPVGAEPGAQGRFAVRQCGLAKVGVLKGQVVVNGLAVVDRGRRVELARERSAGRIKAGFPHDITDGYEAGQKVVSPALIFHSCSVQMKLAS